MGGQINKAYRLRNLRADRLLETLYLVELAHVPFPDEPPIEWPNAQVWRALTERRKKWAQTDLRVESPNERRISEALDQNVEFSIEPEPLKDAIDFINSHRPEAANIVAKAYHISSEDAGSYMANNKYVLDLNNSFVDRQKSMAQWVDAHNIAHIANVDELVKGYIDASLIEKIAPTKNDR